MLISTCFFAYGIRNQLQALDLWMWNCQMFLKFFTNKELWILKMKIFTSYILLLSSFTFASQGNDGPCEYGCWGGEIDKDCERGCITWCVEQVRDSLTTTLSGYGTTHSPWCWTWSWYVGDRKIMMTILVLTTGLTFFVTIISGSSKINDSFNVITL